MELLWRNGQVVLHSQTHRKSGLESNETRQLQKHDQSSFRDASPFGNPATLIQDDETASWLNCPVDDSFEKEFCAPFLSEIPPVHPVGTDKGIRQLEDNKVFKFGSSEVSHVHSGVSLNPMPPPGTQTLSSLHQQHQRRDCNLPEGGVNFGTPLKANLRSSNGQFGAKGHNNMGHGDIRECSAMTVGSSYCGSNQVAIDAAFSRNSCSGNGTRGLSAAVNKDYVEKVSLQTETGEEETAVTSSSGRSGSSFARTCNQSAGTISHGQKRKVRDGEESECQHEVRYL